MRKIYIAIGIIFLFSVAVLYCSTIVFLIHRDFTPIAHAQEVFVASTTKKELSHRQKTWISALEWCESRADNSAVNWYDTDGTPSYYAFQFKPGTLRWLGEKYKVIEKGKSDAEIMELIAIYDVQRAIVEFMVEDPGTRWESQFPGCTRLIGRPPKQ